MGLDISDTYPGHSDVKRNPGDRPKVDLMINPRGVLFVLVLFAVALAFRLWRLRSKRDR